ncbi:MAG: hypothetical protein ACFCVD_13300 [Nodosilinea sp.]
MGKGQGNVAGQGGNVCGGDGGLGQRGDLAGNVLVDCTNPVGANLTHGLHSERSGSEVIQGLVPTARVVKAYHPGGRLQR